MSSQDECCCCCCSPLPFTTDMADCRAATMPRVEDTEHPLAVLISADAPADDAADATIAPSPPAAAAAAATVAEPE